MVRKFAEALEKHRKLGLISHVSPDGDAIGSQLALYQWLQQKGIPSLLFNDDPVPDNLTWLKHHELVQVATKELLDQCDGIIFVDGNHPSRFGKMSGYLENMEKPVYLIDHHLDPPDGFFKGMLWDANASSTAFLVYNLFKDTGPENITKEIAESLYTGIVTDTGSFRFDSVTEETHFAVGDIIKHGKIKPSEIHEHIYDDKSLSQYHLLGMALRNIRLHCNNQLAIMHVTKEMFTSTGCSSDDIDGFVNYPLSISGVLVSVILYERDDYIKISFRGKNAVDLNQVASAFSGGGHFNAAGARHEGPVNTAVSDIVAEIAARIGSGK